LLLTLSGGQAGVAAQTNASERVRLRAGSTNRSAAKSRTVMFDRATLLAQAKLPQPVALPVPGVGTALPDTWKGTNTPLAIRLSQAPPGGLSVRRVSGEDGRLHLEVFSAQGAMSGSAVLQYGEQQLGEVQLKGSLWLTLKPRIGKLPIQVFTPGVPEPVQLLTPTTLVEVRGRQLFVNGEPFLLKGATGAPADQKEADLVHGLGLNTLRGQKVWGPAEQYGFMSIASLNLGEAGAKTVFPGPDAEFEQNLGKCVEWLKPQSVEVVASPFTLIVQLGNERTGGSTTPPGVEPLNQARRHVSQFLMATRNAIKPLAPMLPVGYANQDLSFLAPDCMDVYMHNSFLHKDRYDYPWEDFLRWQGCLPAAGKPGRPFVNSEFGANRYLCQAYHAGPNNPFLEKLHAWNIQCRWAEFMAQGTAGGSIYCLHDLESPRDQGCSCFGILTHDGKPKLACWEVGHLWRDCEVQVRQNELVVSNKRDYWVRECRLTVTSVGGQPVTRGLEDLAPRATRSLALNGFPLEHATNGLRWSMEFTTHAGLVSRAVGAWPVQLEEKDFLQRLQGRDTYPFLRELFDAEVLTAEGKPAPPTLAEMTRADGVIPVALRKRNGVTYLLLMTRENPNRDGALRGGLTMEVAFQGKVEKVDDMTGQSLKEVVEATPIPGGLRLKNVQAARIPGAIGGRSDTPFMLPVYRISPQ
jgi:hypothetical protein